MKIHFHIFFLSLFTASVVMAQVRKAVVKIDDILNVKAALGIATIIQLPETIQSAIIGDQSGFKVEYLDRAVTIKPLRYGVKTNLYLVTEKRRYNIRLTTLSQKSADYIVYVKNPIDAQTPTKWINFAKSVEIDGYKLSILKVGSSNGGFTLIDAILTSKSTDSISLKPDDFWVTQKEISKVINGLFLSDLRLSKDKPIRIGISLANSDLMAKKPITLEVRSLVKLSLSLPAEVLWR